MEDPVVSVARGNPSEAHSGANLVKASHVNVQTTKDEVASESGGAEQVEPASVSGVETGSVVVPPAPREGAKRGRPGKEQERLNKERRIQAEVARRLANPATRSSTRKKTK